MEKKNNIHLSQLDSGRAHRGHEMKPQPKIKLTAWAARKWDPPPCKRTLINWTRDARIEPQPERVGHTYYVDPNAKYIDRDGNPI